MPIDSTKEFKAINISVLTVSDTRTEVTDKSGQILAKKIKEKGHGLTHKHIVKDEKEQIKKTREFEGRLKKTEERREGLRSA